MNAPKENGMKTFLVKFTGSNEWIEMQAESNDELKKKLRGENKSGVIKSPQNMEETMNKPKVHDKHAKTAPADAIYIGRGGKWGNPFIIGKDGTREEVIAKYEKYILGNAELLAQIHELKGKDLVCFCAPKACHGDVLLRLANNKMEEAMEAKKGTPSAALVKLEKLSPEEIEWITNKLEEKILPNLQSDVSNYAKGRQRVWLPYEAPLGNQPFTPGLMDDEVWQWIVDRCAKHGFKAQLALISKGGNIKPHRDTTFAAPWAMGFNLGKCDWHIASSREIARTDYTMSLAGGEVFKFNSKHVHAVTNATADRWSINVWAIANGPAAENANISGRLEQMLEKHPEVQEFIDLHQPGATVNNTEKGSNMKQEKEEKTVKLSEKAQKVLSAWIKELDMEPPTPENVAVDINADTENGYENLWFDTGEGFWTGFGHRYFVYNDFMTELDCDIVYYTPIGAQDLSMMGTYIGEIDESIVLTKEEEQQINLEIVQYFISIGSHESPWVTTNQYVFDFYQTGKDIFDEIKWTKEMLTEEEIARHQKERYQEEVNKRFSVNPTPTNKNDDRKETVMGTKFVIAGTGTRQLINEPKEYRHKVLNYLVELLEGAKTKYGAENVEVISGMAEGFDEALARAAVIANVPFTAALPTGNYVNYYWCQAPLDKDGNIAVRSNGRQDPKGSRTGRNRLNAGLELLGKATKVVHVCKNIYEEFNGTQLHANYIRNQWMVDRADIIWAYNPTGDGGTQDCINRAIKAEKRIFNIVVPKDDGGDDPAPTPDNPEGGFEMKVQEPQGNPTLEQVENRLVAEVKAAIEKETKALNKTIENRKENNMWVELLVQKSTPDLGNEKSKWSTTSRIITNDPAYWLKKLDLKVIEIIEAGGYHYALLDYLFKNQSVCAQVTSFLHPDPKAVIRGERLIQDLAVSWSKKQEDILFGFADFDAEYLIRVKDHSSAEYSTMENYGLKIGNSSKMVKRLVELFKKSPGYKIHDEENRFAIKIVSYEDLLRAFPYLKTLEKSGKMGDGISIGATSTAKYIYRGSKYLTKAQKGRILRGIDSGEYMNHTVRILTNINGVAGLIKGNMILGDKKAINARFREMGIISEDETYEIFTSPDNFKEEFGTDGSFELATLDPHHGPGPVKTNDQMIAQFMDVRGMCTADELIDAFSKYLDKAYNNMVEGKDIQYLEKIQAEHSDSESDRVNQISGPKITNQVNKMAATLNELGLPLSVSQTMMLQRANLISKMFLAETDSRGKRLEVGKNWQAPSSAKKAFTFMPWAYWAYILPKEILFLAGYDIKIDGDEYMEAEYHEETGTIMVPGALYDEIMARLGGGDGDDRVMVHIRKMIMKDGSVRLVAVLIRTPNDWSEYWIIDVNADKYGTVFIADDMDVDMPTIYEEDFDKFNTTSVCGELPSATKESSRPTPNVWDWASTQYNYRVSFFKNAGVGGQVKTKMLQYSINNAPFAVLPCANEDMIDAIQQCKGDAEDLEMLDDWSTHATAKIMMSSKMDAYWWYSRNMFGTQKRLVNLGVLPAGGGKGHLDPKNSPIVRDLMVPREQLVRKTKSDMIDWLNNNIVEIPELSICISRQTEDKYKLLVTNLNKKFNGTQGMTAAERSAHFEKAAQAVMDELNKYKEENTEEEFFRHILRLVRMSYLMKERSLKQNWNQKNPNNNYDRWLFTAVTDAEVIPTDYFFQAMIWFRDTFKKN